MTVSFADAFSAAVPRKVRYVVDAVHLSTALFMLPFTYMGMFLAGHGAPTWWQVVWVTVALLSIRTVGFCVNRVVDLPLDRANPRTQTRHLVTGRLRSIDLVVTGVLFLGFFFLATAMLNRMTLILAPLAAAVVIWYTYSKRFTWTTNLFLGITIALGAAGGWIAVSGTITWAVALLYVSLAAWAAGFDLIQDSRDCHIHRELGLHSLPSKFGVTAAFRWSRSLYVLMIVGLAGVGILQHLHWPYYVGLTIAAGLLYYQHRIVSPSDLSRWNEAFFKMNAYISATITLFAIAALYV